MTVLILATVLILGIAFLQMKQGLFSALTMTVCTILSAALAAATYKQAAVATGLYDKMDPLLVNAGFLALLFLAAIFTLRTITDKLIREDIYFNLIIDRIGGAICGIITGITMIGVLMVVAQLLPLPASILGYKPYSGNLQRQQTLAPFYPDDFVLGLGRIVCSNWGQGASDEDVLRSAFCNRNTAALPCRRDAGKGALVKVEAYTFKAKNIDVPSNLGKKMPDSMTRVLVIRTEIDVKKALDEDSWWRLPATQFRLECDNGKHYYPVGYLFYNIREKSWLLADAPAAQLAVQRPQDAATPKRGLIVDWVYRIPIKAAPKTITFRQVVRKNVKNPKKTFPLGSIKMKMTALKNEIPNRKKKRKRRRR